MTTKSSPRWPHLLSNTFYITFDNVYTVEATPSYNFGDNQSSHVPARRIKGSASGPAERPMRAYIWSRPSLYWNWSNSTRSCRKLTPYRSKMDDFHSLIMASSETNPPRPVESAAVSVRDMMNMTPLGPGLAG